MKVFGILATVSVYLSLGIFVLCGILSLVICIFISSDDLFKKFDKYYFNIGTYFCLPLYGLSFLSEGISEIGKRNPVLSFVMAGVFFLITFILINRKKIKK